MPDRAKRTPRPSEPAIKPANDWLPDNPYVARDIGIEQASDHAARLLMDAVVQIAAPVWRWGDGHGGWLVELLFQRAAAHGLAIPDQPDHFATRSLLARVAERDGWECAYCGAALGWGHPSVVVPQLDHVIPKCQGGTDAISNRAMACQPCNQAKGGRTPEQWVNAE